MKNLALEVSSRGLAVYGMQGFDYEQARTDLEVPDNLMLWQSLQLVRKDQRTFRCNFRKENIQPIENHLKL